MINLYDIIAQSQQGQGLQTLAQQYGLSVEQTRRATEALLPAFTVGLNRATQSPDAFQGFMQQMGNYGVNPTYFDQPQAAFSPQGMMNGNALLEMMFGNKDVSRAVTQQAALSTGIGEGILKAMLPVIASMVLGGLFKGFGQQAPQAPQSPGGDIIGDLLRNMTGQGSPAPQQAPQQSPTGDIFGEIIRNMTGQGQPQQPTQPTQQPSGMPDLSSLGPWGSILGSILGGVMGGNPQAPGRDPRQAQNPYGQDQHAEQEEPEGEYEDEPQDAPEDTRPGNVRDIFGQIFGTGKQVQDTQLQDLNDIFDKFNKGR